MAWDHGGPDFPARFDKSTAQAQEMKEGALRVLWYWGPVLRSVLDSEPNRVQRRIDILPTAFLAIGV